MSDDSRQERKGVSPPSHPVTTTVEVALYVALVVVALVLRLIRLDWLPLGEREAALAFPAWEAARPESAAGVPGEPLLFHLLRLVFWLLGGGSDVTARLVPACAGVLAVALTWRLRGVWGRSSALVLAGLFAVSPVWLFASRQVSGQTLSLAAIVLLLGGLAANRPRDRMLVPVAAGLALVASNFVYGLILAAVVYAVVVALRGELRDHWRILAGMWPENADRQGALVLFVGTIILAATGLLSQPSGFAALVEGPASWAVALLDGPRGVGQWLLLPLAAYAPLTSVFGLVGLFLAARRLRRIDVFLLLWTGVALAIALATRSSLGAMELLLPLTLAAALAIASLLEEVAEQFQWQEDGVMVAILLTILGFGLIQAWSHCYHGAASSERLMAGALLLALALVVAYSFLWGARLALRVTGLTALLVLSVLSWANGTPLAYRGGRMVRELLHAEYATSDTATLAHNLSLASWAETRDPDALETYVAPELRPQLAWPLRQREALVWQTPSEGASPGALVLPGVTDRLALGSGTYRGTRYAIVGRWQPQLDTLQNFLRWYLQRRSPSGASQAGDIAYDQVELYLRTE